MNKSLILNRIKLAYSLKNDAELARFLEIQRNTLSNWYSRNTIDYDKVFLKCESLNFDWLLTGQGEMLKNAPAPEPAPQESHTGADRYMALLEDKIALLEKNNALQERENTYLSEKIKGLENTIKELKSKLQKTIAKQENDIINLQGEDISVMKSPNLPPDDPLQPSRRV